MSDGTAPGTAQPASRVPSLLQWAVVHIFPTREQEVVSCCTTFLDVRYKSEHGICSAVWLSVACHIQYNPPVDVNWQCRCTEGHVASCCVVLCTVQFCCWCVETHRLVSTGQQHFLLTQFSKRITLAISWMGLRYTWGGVVVSPLPHHGRLLPEQCSIIDASLGSSATTQGDDVIVPSSLWTSECLSWIM